MCGRYAASKDQTEILEEFDVELDATSLPSRSILARPQNPPAGQPDFNMAPSKQAPVVLTRPRRGPDAVDPAEQAEPGQPVRQLRLLTWGLVPSWAKDVKVGLRTINARSESVLDKPAYARAAAARRCLVPADGWYEWQRSPTVTDAKGKARKQPFYVHRADGGMIAFAGLYEFWRDPTVEDREDPRAWLTTFTILTTSAEPGLDRIHDRQPLVLDRPAWDAWLDPAVTDPDVVRGLLAAAPPGRFEAYPVTTAVNATANNGRALLTPADPDQLRGVLDPTTGEIIGS
ncbi:MAG: SOS response-associated peptidase [Dermatophilaceae bacterium]